MRIFLILQAFIMGAILPCPAHADREGILELRRLHIALGTAVRDAYGWQDLDLGHTFVEVEALPENDCTRFTVTPTALKELLKRLLAENQRRATAEPKEPVRHKRGKRSSRSTQQQRDLF